MRPRRICAVLVENDAKAARSVVKLVDLFEVRIDLIGEGWQKLVQKLKKPWIATNRSMAEGGQWALDEASRIEKLIEASRLGASIVDVELATKDLRRVVKDIKRKAECLVSYHDFQGTPPLEDLQEIVARAMDAGADIAKVVTTAQRFEDNLVILRLLSERRRRRMVAFCMGPLGVTSRVFSPMAGAEFTYAAIARGQESASGQLTAAELRQIYEASTNG